MSNFLINYGYSSPEQAVQTSEQNKAALVAPQVRKEQALRSEFVPQVKPVIRALAGVYPAGGYKPKIKPTREDFVPQVGSFFGGQSNEC